ncbi:MAG: phosphotransferase [Anaerolineae bacterium]|nr:phosphotransferase [Anaerolineae bacterium]
MKSTPSITIDWLKNALPWVHSGCELMSVEVEPDCGGPSLLGRLTRVRLRYTTPGCGASSIIVKFQAQSSDWEAQIYRLLAEAETLSVPRLFGAFEHGTLVMEDLSPARTGSQMDGCTLPQAQDVLSILAEIHGRFWGDPRLPALQPEQFAAAININMEQCWDAFKSRYQEILNDVAADFEWMWHNAGTVSAHRLSEPATLFHGDVHTENLLFSEDGKRRPILIDWQLAGRGLAANDVSFFLVKSLTVKQRQANEERLLQGYFNLLPGRVQTAYGFDRFKLDYRACVTRSMVSAVMLVGPRFVDRPDRLALADALATRVIAAVQDLNPVDAIRELGKDDGS